MTPCALTVLVLLATLLGSGCAERPSSEADFPAPGAASAPIVDSPRKKTEQAPPKGEAVTTGGDTHTSPETQAPPPETKPEPIVLHPDVEPIVVSIPAYSRAEPAGCPAGEDLRVDEFSFEVPEAARARLTFATDDVPSSLRVEVRSPDTAPRCTTETILAGDGYLAEWTGNVGAGRHRVLLTASQLERRAVSPRDTQLRIGLELRPPAKVDYTSPLRPDEILPATAGGGNTFHTDARIRLSCAEEGAPTAHFDLPVRERSAFTFWIPPEIDLLNNVFALLRPGPSGYEEIDCGHTLHAILPRGRYLLVAAGASRDRMGEFFLPYRLHSLEAEERAARAAPSLPLGKTIQGSTRARQNVFNHCDIRRVGHAAPDRIYRVRVPDAGHLTVEVQPRGELDGWVSLRASDLSPLDPERVDCEYFPSGSPLTVPVSRGEYFVVVDGIGISPEEGPGFAGDFSVRATFEPAAARE